MSQFEFLMLLKSFSWILFFVKSPYFISFKIFTMKRIILSACLFTVLLLIACNQSANTSGQSDTDTTTSSVTGMDTSSMPAYDPSMDPATTGGKFVKMLRDTLNVKMYEFTVKPGESWAMHTHPNHTVYVVQGGKMALYIREMGRQDTLTFPTGMALVSGPLSDSGRNIGNTTIKMVVTDIYRPFSK